MGMAASQCRLLNLTSRLSDLELRAQTVSNSKIRLSMNSERAATEYTDALNKQKLEVYAGVNNDGSAKYIDATASNLTTYDAISSTDKQRFIKNSSGQVLVTENVKKAYDASNGDLSTFLNKMGCTSINNATTTQLQNLVSDIQKNTAYTKAPVSSGPYDLLTTDVSIADKLKQMNTLLTTYSNTLGTEINTTTDATKKAELTSTKAKTDDVLKGMANAIAWCSDSILNVDQDLLKLVITGTAGTLAGKGVLAQTIQNQGRPSLSGITPDNNISTILNTIKNTTDKENNSPETKYYTNVFNEIKESGGCIAPGDDNMNSNEWLTTQVTSGNVFLYEKGNGTNSSDFTNVDWNSGDATLSMKDDTSGIAKAEAKYDAIMASIETKDKIFDLELKNIDTEHTATQTEVDSVKKVIDKNIERNFKMFQA